MHFTPRIMSKGSGTYRSIEPTAVLQLWYADVMSSLPLSMQGNSHALLIIDAYSQYVFIRPLKTTSSKDALSAFLQVVAVAGVPNCLVTDYGQSFQSVFHDYMTFLNIIHSKRTPQRSQEESLCEYNIGHFKRFFARYLTSISTTARKSWCEYLDIATINYNNTQIYSLGISRNQMYLHGRKFSNLSPTIHYTEGEVNEFYKKILEKRAIVPYIPHESGPSQYIVSFGSCQYSANMLASATNIVFSQYFGISHKYCVCIHTK